MLEHLQCPRKGLVGPWGHEYPNLAGPGPQIDFLHETMRWWGKWLKGVETGVMDEPKFRCYLQHSIRPQTYYDTRPGHWVAQSSWPDDSFPLHRMRMGLAPGLLTHGVSTSQQKLDICSPQTVGFAAGRWIVMGSEGEGPGDQRRDAGGCLNFDTEPLQEPVDLLGQVVLHVRVASDRPDALIAAALSEVLPDGAATRLTWGVLNLTHRDSHEKPQALETGQFYDVTVQLKCCGQRIDAGNRLRLALSTTYFPVVWPSPEVTTLTIDCAQSSVLLPVRSANALDAQLRPFGPADSSAPLLRQELRPVKHSNMIAYNNNSDETTLSLDWDEGKWEINETGWRFGERSWLTYGVRSDDPLTAYAEQRFHREFGRDDLELSIKGRTKMSMTKTTIEINARVDAWEQGRPFFGRDFVYSIPRDHV